MDTSTLQIQTRTDITLTPTQASAILTRWLGHPTTCRSVRQLKGGICSGVFELVFDRPPHSAVVKLHPAEDTPLAREAHRLNYLREHTAVPCPQVYLQDDSADIVAYSILLVERLPGNNLWSAKLAPEQRVTVERELAEVLINLHSHTSDMFGEPNSPDTADWLERFIPDLEDFRQDMNDFLTPDALALLDDALSRAPKVLRDFGQPTLTHNDLWGGNIMVHERDGIWHLSGLIDPGLVFCDVEKELAYLQHFETVGEPFFDVYTSRLPIRYGYEHRRLFYYLHTDMLHIWLGYKDEFTDHLLQTCRQVIQWRG